MEPNPLEEMRRCFKMIDQPPRKQRGHHRCYTCYKVFASKVLLHEHKSSVHDRSIACDMCGKLFWQLRSLERHKKVSHRGITELPLDLALPHKCEECDQRFNLGEDLAKHARQCKSLPQACSSCSYRFANRDQLDEHQMTHHPELKPFECGACHEQFKKDLDLQRHIFACQPWLNNGQGKKYTQANVLALPTVPVHVHKCGDCNEAFASLQAMLRHQRERHVKACDTCHSKFKSEGDLRNHILYEPCSERFRCQECQAVLNTKEALHQHQLDLHAKVCDTCHLSFTREEDLKKHIIQNTCVPLDCNALLNRANAEQIRQHDQEDFGPAQIFECHSCHLYFSSDEDLRSHLEGENCSARHRCKTCNAIVQSKEALIHHQNYGHEVKCDVCNDHFRDSDMYHLHLDWDRGKECTANKIACKSCPKLLANVRQWEVHFAKAHPVILRFECDLCRKQFKSDTDLQVHIFDCRILNNLASSSQATPSTSGNESSPSTNSLDHPANNEANPGDHQTIYKCAQCQRRYLCLAELKRHVSDGPCVLLKHKCKHCQKLFASKELLDEHQVANHPVFECENCHMKLASDLLYQVHIFDCEYMKKKQN